MRYNAAALEDTGLEVVDLETDAAFAERRLHVHDAAAQMEAMTRLALRFVESPKTILQELVNAAIALCGADSAGISMEREQRTDASYFEWVATAGSYEGFLNAVLPRYPSACGLCIERGKPQIFRVSPLFFDRMGIEGVPVTDGILIPWQVEEMRGTIWIMAHVRTDAFDANDCRIMQALGNFAAMGVRQQRQQRTMLAQARAAAAAAMANDLAHKINNPLQSLTNLLYLAGQGQSGGDAQLVGRAAMEDLVKLSALVKELLEPTIHCE